MSFYDFLIIYFACGAPVGVYYFLQNRRQSNRQKFLLKTFLVFIAWMPFAVRHFTQNRFFQNHLKNHFGGKRFSDSGLEKKIQSAKKRLEKALFEIDPNISIYEIREILDRYVSFAFFCQFDEQDSQFALTENEIFRIAGHDNSELASICLQRRNRKRLSFHHTLARLNFLDLLAGKSKLAATAIEFVSLLNDFEAKESIEEMFDIKPQTEKALDVKDAEKRIWNSELQQATFTKAISTRLKAMTATVSLREKD